MENFNLAQLRELNIDGIVIDHTPFAELTTLHLGGRPAATLRCQTKEAAIKVVTLLDAHSIPLLIVGGGSNLVVADGDVDMVAVVLEFDAVTLHTTDDPQVTLLQAEAGAVWDEVVKQSIEAGLGGLECLSGIPGSAGATPVQNVGAYGVEVSDVLTRVELLDRVTGAVEWVDASALELSYRYSNLKFTQRAVVLAVEFALKTDGMSAPLRFGELTRQLGTDPVDAATVREKVLELRRGKGMVYDPADHDTWSAGSFFTNPIVKEVPQQVIDGEGPCFEVPGGYKLSAAWLIDHAGFTKGYPGADAPARLSTKHTLALTNRGNATTADLVALARDIRAGVFDYCGVTLEPEPVWVGVALDD